MTVLAGSKVDTSGRPDAPREDIGEVLIEQDSVWELRVQLCTDLERMAQYIPEWMTASRNRKWRAERPEMGLRSG